MLRQWYEPCLKLSRQLLKVTRLISAVVKPLLPLKKDSRPLYYGAGIIVGSSSLYYSAYKLLGPALCQGTLTCLKMVAAHPYSIGLSLVLLSDLPVTLIAKGILLVLTKSGQWALRTVLL